MRNLYKILIFFNLPHQIIHTADFNQQQNSQMQYHKNQARRYEQIIRDLAQKIKKVDSAWQEDANIATMDYSKYSPRAHIDIFHFYVNQNLAKEHWQAVNDLNGFKTSQPVTLPAPNVLYVLVPIVIAQPALNIAQ